MTAQFSHPPGATPLGPDDIAGLIPTWIATQSDLNQAEGDNIQRATVWALTRTWRPEQILRERELKDLHARMFGDVWGWAGTFRSRQTNLGVAPYAIGPSMVDVLADAHAWLATVDDLAASRDEIAVRFHHRVVAVHPFANGNGRHARLAADILVTSLGGSRFTWGRDNLAIDGDARRTYLDALILADRTLDYGPLVAFARS